MSAPEETAVSVRLDALTEKMDAIHISLSTDIGDLRRSQLVQGEQITKTELRIARIQGAGTAVIALMPFLVFGLDKVIN